MDINKNLPVIIFCLLLATTGFGRQKPEGLKVGDKLPEMFVTGIINQSANEVKLRNLYKDGLLIIDFWATWCSPCVSEMKFLDSLKNQHPNKFNVLMVSYEDKALIHSFLSRPANADVKTSNLVLAANDTLLRKMFPHKVVPHNVWVDRNGIVKAITSQKEVTSKNILAFNEDTVISEFKVKKDNLSFDPVQTFHLADSIFSYRSIISPYIEGINGGVYGGGINPRIYFGWNGSILSHYWNAYSNCTGSRRTSLVEVHTKDSLKFFTPVGDMEHLLKGSKYKDLEEWQKENAFCYALTLPKGVSDTILRDYMFSDLRRQFTDVKPAIETRNIRCTIITKVREFPLQRNLKNNREFADIKFIPGYKLSIKNATIYDLMDWWFRLNAAKWEPDPFLIDISNEQNTRLDMELDFSAEASKENPGITPSMFYRQLRKYGFEFNKVVRPYPILVLYDKM